MKSRASITAVLVLSSPLFYRFLPSGEPESLRSTLALLPAIVAGALAIENWIRLNKLQRLRDREGAALAAGLLALVVASLLWQKSGLAVADGLLAAGFFLFLFYWVARTLVRLRPLLGAKLPSRPSAIFFWLPFLVYCAMIPWTTAHRPPDGDEPYNLLIAHSLAYDLDADLTNNYDQGDYSRFLDREIGPQLGDPTGPAGQIYSRHNFLVPLLLALPYFVAGKYGAMAMMAAITAALAWVTLRLARHYLASSPGEVLLAWGVLAFVPPLLLYSSQLWVEVPAALLVVLALEALRAPARDTSSWSWRKGLSVGLPIVALPLIKIRFMLLSLSLLGLLWLHSKRRWRAALLLTLILAGTAGGILVHNQLRFGNPLKVHRVEELNLTGRPVQSYLQGSTGLFLDSAFGLFSSAPIWLLLVPGVSILVRRRNSLLIDTGALLFPYLAFVAPRSEWYGGWSPPFRYGLVFLPLLALVLVPAFEARHRALPRIFIPALWALTLILGLLWAVQPGWTYNLADGTSRITEHLGSQLGVDLGRLLPSYVRPRTSALWWPLLVVAFAALWWLPSAKRWRAGALGATGLLVASSAFILAAAHAPTTRVEVEDAFVRKSGGELQPPLWTVDRWRHRGAWLLPEGERIEIPVASGGAEVDVEVEARFLRRRRPPMTLVVRAGEQVLDHRLFRVSTDWGVHHFGPLRWVPGEPLILEVLAPSPSSDEKHRILIDRVRLTWSR